MFCLITTKFPSSLTKLCNFFLKKHHNYDYIVKSKSKLFQTILQSFINLQSVYFLAINMFDNLNYVIYILYSYNLYIFDYHKTFTKFLFAKNNFLDLNKKSAYYLKSTFDI